MPKQILLFILIVIICSCNSDQSRIPDSKQKQDSEYQVKENNERTKLHKTDSDDYSKILKYFIMPVFDTSIAQIIDRDMAVFIEPSTEQIIHLKAKYGEEDFYIAADDNNYYLSELTNLLDSLEIETMTTTKRVLTFKGTYEEYGMTLDPEGQDSIYWSVILFNRDRDPIFLNLANPDTLKIKDYMNIK